MGPALLDSSIGLCDLPPELVMEITKHCSNHTLFQLALAWRTFLRVHVPCFDPTGEDRRALQHACQDSRLVQVLLRCRFLVKERRTVLFVNEYPALRHSSTWHTLLRFCKHNRYTPAKTFSIRFALEVPTCPAVYFETIREVVKRETEKGRAQYLWRDVWLELYQQDVVPWHLLENTWMNALRIGRCSIVQGCLSDRQCELIAETIQRAPLRALFLWNVRFGTDAGFPMIADALRNHGSHLLKVALTDNSLGTSALPSLLAIMGCPSIQECSLDGNEELAEALTKHQRKQSQ